MTGGDQITDLSGGPSRHVPVLLHEVCGVLAPASGLKIVDGTFGAGGYSRALLEAGAQVFAIDRDPDAIREGREMVEEFGGRLTLAMGEFADMETLLDEAGWRDIDGIVLDIGVSSMQLDEAERGFSFRNDGPLDMRMAQDGASASDVINHVDQSDLTRIIGILGEERKASAISRAIVRAREKEVFSRTTQLSSLIEQVMPRKSSDKIHPATRTFQALRIFVNRELEQLAQALFVSERVLGEGGRLVVVTFHSLEDRIVKTFMTSRSGEQRGSRHMPEIAATPAVYELEGRGLVKPSQAECESNPRARSAKLRWATRTANGPMIADLSIFGLPNLPLVSDFSASKGF